MNHYWFEHWQLGRVISIEVCLAQSVADAVSTLSDKFKGVFLLVSSQTEEERNQENLIQLDKIQADFD